MTQKIDINKRYRTNDGKEVVIYTTDGADKAFPVVGEVRLDDSISIVSKWSVYGQVHGTYMKAHCLVEVKPRIKRTIWVNVYSDGIRNGAHNTKQQAEHYASSGIVACVKVEIDCEEGEGL
jgi:hypothetical protein